MTTRLPKSDLFAAGAALGLISTTAWDADRLGDVIGVITNALNVLDENYSAMRAIAESDLPSSWESEAGRAYASRLGEDMATLKLVIEQYEQIRQDLETARNKYADGERSLASQLNGVYSRI